MGGLRFPRFLKSIFSAHQRQQSFVVLDIGTFSVKALYVASARKDGSARILASAVRRLIGNDINADGSFNMEGIRDASRTTLDELKRQTGKRLGFTREIVVGTGGGFVFGKTLYQTYIRENPEEEIDVRELANIIQKIQQRNFEQIRRGFKKETGRSELEAHIIGASILEMKIDGYEVVNPVGFRGKEITCALFNSYTPKAYLAIFEKLIASLELHLVSLISEPYSVFSSLTRAHPALLDFILIDIGGSITEISIARKGKLEDVRSISIGGSSFTKSIAENLKIGFWEAENIKQRFAKGGVSGRVARRVEEIITRDTDVFLHGLEMVLADVSQAALLPGNIYLYGGGSSVSFIHKSLGRKLWRETLSFFSQPKIETLLASRFFFPAKDMREMNDVQWVTSVAMAETSIFENMRNDELTKVLERSLRLIQSR